jgi:hypothetical protein
VKVREWVIWVRILALFSPSPTAFSPLVTLVSKLLTHIPHTHPKIKIYTILELRAH